MVLGHDLVRIVCDIVVTTCRAQAEVSINIHFQVTCALFYTCEGDNSTAIQALNRLRTWSELRRHSYIFIQRGQGNMKAYTSAISRKRRRWSSSVRATGWWRANVFFVDQKQRILSTFLKDEWLASLSVEGMKYTDDPWVSSIPEWLMTAAPLHRLDDVRPDGVARGIMTRH